MSDLHVRRLETGDLFRLAKILAKCTGDARQKLYRSAKELRDQFVTDDDEAGEIENVDLSGDLLFAIFEAAVGQEQALKEFFGGLVGMDAAAFSHTPFDTLLVIIEQAMEQDDLPGFLSRASRLATKFGTSST